MRGGFQWGRAKNRLFPSTAGIATVPQLRRPPDIFRRQAVFQVSDTVMGVPLPRPKTSAALCSARAISNTPKELMSAKYSPG